MATWYKHWTPTIETSIKYKVGVEQNYYLKQNRVDALFELTTTGFTKKNPNHYRIHFDISHFIYESSSPHIGTHWF